MQQEPPQRMQPVFCMVLRSFQERGFGGADSAREYKVVTFYVSASAGLRYDLGAHRMRNAV